MKVETVTMGLAEFFQSLLPNITRRQIVVDITHSYDELRQVVIPMYDLNIPGEFKGDVASALDKALRKSKINFNKNAYATINKCLKTVEDQEEDVIKMMETSIGSEVIKEVMDFKKINIIYYIEALNFLNDYARTFIVALVHDEFDADTAAKITGPVDKATRAWVMDYNNMESFVKVLEVLTMPTKTFLDKIKDLEGHVFEPTTWESVKATSGSKLDPMGFGFVSVRWNPVYHLGIAWNTWRVRRHERNKEELAKLQLMVLALEEQRSKSPDKEKMENLVKQIKYHSNRINVISAKIEDMEGE